MDRHDRRRPGTTFSGSQGDGDGDSDPPEGGDGDMAGDGDGDGDGDGPAIGATIVCGDGRVTGEETCDTGILASAPGACPAECPALGACAPRAMNGTGCRAECVLLTASCEGGDDCCPPGCTPQSDGDCSATCGDGEVDSRSETCEPDSDTPCPDQADCDDDDACTEDLLMGSADNCNARCEHTPITGVQSGDACCPPGANANSDDDCEPMCGNDVREAGEECDGTPGCDDACVFTPTPDQQRCLDLADADACQECACISCSSAALACVDAADATAVMQCESVVDCGLAADCVGNACYCGTANLVNCGSGGANGACRTEIEAVAQAVSGMSDPLTILNLSGETTNPLGRAMALSNCAVANCPAVCP